MTSERRSEGNKNNFTACFNILTTYIFFIPSDITVQHFTNHPSLIQISPALHQRISVPARVLISNRITWTVTSVMAPLIITLLWTNQCVLTGISTIPTAHLMDQIHSSIQHRLIISVLHGLPYFRWGNFPKLNRSFFQRGKDQRKRNPMANCYWHYLTPLHCYSSAVIYSWPDGETHFHSKVSCPRTRTTQWLRPVLEPETLDPESIGNQLAIDRQPGAPPTKLTLNNLVTDLITATKTPMVFSSIHHTNLTLWMVFDFNRLLLWRGGQISCILSKILTTFGTGFTLSYL